MADTINITPRTWQILYATLPIVPWLAGEYRFISILLLPQQNKFRSYDFQLCTDDIIAYTLKHYLDQRPMGLSSRSKSLSRVQVLAKQKRHRVWFFYSIDTRPLIWETRNVYPTTRFHAAANHRRAWRTESQTQQWLRKIPAFAFCTNGVSETSEPSELRPFSTGRIRTRCTFLTWTLPDFRLYLVFEASAP